MYEAKRQVFEISLTDISDLPVELAGRLRGVLNDLTDAIDGDDEKGVCPVRQIDAKSERAFAGVLDYEHNGRDAWGVYHAASIGEPKLVGVVRWLKGSDATEGQWQLYDQRDVPVGSSPDLDRLLEWAVNNVALCRK